MSLGITRDEYALCSYIHYRSAWPGNESPGFCCDSKDQIADFIGITRQGLHKMVAKLEGKNLIERSGKKGFLRVTEAWILADNGVNKVDTHDEKAENSCKQSLRKVSTKFTQTVNKVDTQYKVMIKEIKDEVVVAREEENQNSTQPTEQTQTTTTTTPNEKVTLTVEEKNTPPHVAPPPPATIGVLESPNAQTAHDLKASMSKFYKQNPTFWTDGILGFSKGAKYTQMQQIQIVEEWCLYTIQKHGGGRTFATLNAELGKWFRNQENADRWKKEADNRHGAKTGQSFYTPPPAGTQAAPAYVPA